MARPDVQAVFSIRRIPEWYVQHPCLSFSRGIYGQQGQGRFKELEDRGQQVAEGEAPGEEGESHSFGLFLDGNLDQQVSPRSQRTDEGVCRSGSLRGLDDAGGPTLGCDQGLMSVRPPDPVADAYFTMDDFQNLALARRGADLR